MATKPSLGWPAPQRGKGEGGGNGEGDRRNGLPPRLGREGGAETETSHRRQGLDGGEPWSVVAHCGRLVGGVVAGQVGRNHSVAGVGGR
jgi:hypothetical protein